MLYVKKDKSSYVDCGYDCITPDDSYKIEDIELEEKILQLFPDFDFVIEDDEVVDVVSTKPEPVDVEAKVQELEEQNQMLTDCLLEMSEIVYGGDL